MKQICCVRNLCVAVEGCVLGGDVPPAGVDRTLSHIFSFGKGCQFFFLRWLSVFFGEGLSVFNNRVQSLHLNKGGLQP